MPPTREMVVRSGTGVVDNVANGLTAGEYRLPIFDFIFPENHRIGDPVIPNNFQDLPFLAFGSGPLFGTGPVVGQLDPWPGDAAPARAVCVPGVVAPIISDGPDITTGSGLPVLLSATRILLDNTSYGGTVAWSQSGAGRRWHC